MLIRELPILACLVGSILVLVASCPALLPFEYLLEGLGGSCCEWVGRMVSQPLRRGAHARPRGRTLLIQVLEALCYCYFYLGAVHTKKCTCEDKNDEIRSAWGRPTSRINCNETNNAA